MEMGRRPLWAEKKDLTRKFRSGDRRVQAGISLGGAVLVAVATFYGASGLAGWQTALAVVFVTSLFLVASWSFIRMRRQRKEYLLYHAHHDSLTGLLNRALFVEYAECALLRAVRVSSLVAVLIVDLDNFEEIDHSLGHEAGDQLLETLGKRLETTVRPGGTVARVSAATSSPSYSKTYPIRTRRSLRRSRSGRR